MKKLLTILAASALSYGVNAQCTPDKTNIDVDGGFNLTNMHSTAGASYTSTLHIFMTDTFKSLGNKVLDTAVLDVTFPLTSTTGVNLGINGTANQYNSAGKPFCLGGQTTCIQLSGTIPAGTASGYYSPRYTATLKWKDGSSQVFTETQVAAAFPAFALKIGVGTVGINNLQINGLNDLAVVNNPFSVTFNSDKERALTFNIVDATGRIVSSSVENVVVGSQSINLNAANIVKGTYILSITDGTATTNHKFLIAE